MVALVEVLGLPVFWLIVGLVGQGLFFGRFLVQWIASERARRSVIPLAFWHMSIAGSLITLVYAIYREDPVFILGQTTGTLVYARNLYLRSLEKQSPS
ncbi:MAG: lipid-A-disaccharide synthase N-terminal domain-containing protein [Planctomycetota bacterium]